MDDKEKLFAVLTDLLAQFEKMCKENNLMYALGDRLYQAYGDDRQRKKSYKGY